jgi:tetratricopeptide (TPR) repeat protein
MYAARVARILKERAEWERAANGYDHAIFVARGIEDWSAYSDAYCGLGGLYAERGRLPRARKLFRRALRAAIRHHEGEQVANAYHYVFTLEAVAGNWEQAEQMAMQALLKYSAQSPKRPRLARDPPGATGPRVRRPAAPSMHPFDFCSKAGQIHRGAVMISPEESRDLGRIREGYREWLERARRESDERRMAARRHPDDGGRRLGDAPDRPGSAEDRRG